MQAVEKLLSGEKLSREDCRTVLEYAGDREVGERLRREAVRLRQQYYENKVFVRGLIEFTNYCRNNCYYCGIRRDNRRAVRYRLSEQEILSCCEQGHQLGFRTFVLQGGEDPYYTEERMVSLISAIKTSYPDCALTLSIGEKSYDTYRAFREAGADRYLLRHETADNGHYRMLHPEEMSLENRKQCLYHLKELGYQVGAGFMVGSPGQTIDTLAEDLLFLQELQPQMVGIGPFIPHHETTFGMEPPGSVSLTIYLLSVIRLMLPAVLLPATTALGTADARGREKGLLAGANVVMPNLSPMQNRKQYDLYDNKICTGQEAAEGLAQLAGSIEDTGYRLVYERGDAVKQHFGS